MAIEQSRRSSLKKIAAGLGAAALGRTGLSFAQQDTLKVAAVYPLSGVLAAQGGYILQGAKVAAEQFNRSGGVMGKKVELVIRDDKASPAEAALVAREIFGSGIKFIVGGVLTAPSMAIVNLLAENDGVFVLGGSSLMAMTHESFNPRAFRASPNALMNLYALAKAMAMNHPEVTRWGGIASDNQFSTDNYKLFMAGIRKFYKEIAKKNVEILDPVLAPFPATDFKVQIAKFMSSPLEGFFMGVVGSDFSTFMAQAKPQGLYNKVKVFADFGNGIGAGRVLGASMPKEFWSATPWYPDPKNGSAGTKQLIKDYQAMTGDKALPDSGAFYGYAGMTAMLSAIRNAKSLEPPVVRVALERLTLDLPNGAFAFRKEDHGAITNVEAIKMGSMSAAPGWEVKKVVTVQGADVMEPPAPGQKFVIEG